MGVLRIYECTVLFENICLRMSGKKLLFVAIAELERAKRLSGRKGWKHRHPIHPVFLSSRNNRLRFRFLPATERSAPGVGQ